MPRETIVEVATRLLRHHGIRTTAQIAAEVVRLGITRAADPEASVHKQLAWKADFHALPGHRWMLVDALNEIRAAHRVTDQESASNTLALGDDLPHLVHRFDFELRRPDGEPFQVLRGTVASAATGLDTGLALRGSARWPGPPGALVAVSAPGGFVRVEAATPATPEARMRVRRMVDVARRKLDSRQAELFGVSMVSLNEVLLDLLGEDPGFFDLPLPPLSEAFAGSGLELHHGQVAAAGSDWSRFDAFVNRWRTGLWERKSGAHGDEHQGGEESDGDDVADDEIDGEPAPGFDDAILDALIEDIELDDQEARALGVILDLYVVWRVPNAEGYIPAHSESMPRNLVDLLALERVAMALGQYAWTDDGVEVFVRDLAGAARGRAAAPVEYLLGECAEARDSVEEAERHYRAAVAADPAFFPVRARLHAIEVDRGNYAAALGHLRTVGVPATEAARAWLEELVRPAFGPVGRNEPCPCGSGRKYKVCHMNAGQGAVALPPAQALFRKLAMWVQRPDYEAAQHRLVHEVIGEPEGRRAGHRGRDAGHPKKAERAEALLLGDRAPQVDDVMLFERGWLDRLLAARGGLLPPAERTLAEAWRSSPRSLFEVAAIRPGEGATLRDTLADGPPLEVLDRSMSRTMQPLDLVVLRLRPDGSGRYLATDGIRVPRFQRPFVADLVRRADTIGFLRWISNPEPAVRMQNMEGEPILLVTATYRLPDPGAARDGLARTFDSDQDGDGPVFREIVQRRGQAWTRGTISIDGDVATIDANSKKRADRLVRALLKAAPGARLVKREERGLEEVEEEHTVSAGAEPGVGSGARVGVDLASSELDPRDPDIASAIDQLMRDFERAWVDESIPALGGRTPRQALRDPAGLREVLALLDDMEWQRRTSARDDSGLGSGMDPSRIRMLLGLPQRRG